MRETKQSHRQNVGKRWSEDQAAKNSGRYGKNGQVIRKRCSKRPSRWVTMFKTVSVAETVKTWKDVERGRSRPDVVKSTRRAPDTEDTVEKPVFWRKRGPKRENVERGRSRPDVVKSTRRAPDTEDTVGKPVFWVKTWAETG